MTPLFITSAITSVLHHNIIIMRKSEYSGPLTCSKSVLIKTPSVCYRSVDCYDTCIIGLPFDPTVPIQCCADPLNLTSDVISTTDGTPNFIIARLFSPNEPGMSNYRLNTYCK